MPTTVRAKFRVETISHSTDYSSVTLWPVIEGSPENKDFYKYRPAGTIDLQIVKRDTAEMFVPGKEYYVDFTPAN